MEALTLGLLLLVAVLASSLIDQIIPRVSLPLIQIVIGLLIAVVAGGEVEVTLDPELFLVMFIAPLLYDEAKHADKQALWRERKPVLSLAIGLVVATTLVIGFLLNAFVPSIPLAAAFALGAALGPTDAVAVSSLSKQVDIPKRQASMLKGELLLNDASGIVSFQFAIAAVVTGSFSWLTPVDFSWNSSAVCCSAFSWGCSAIGSSSAPAPSAWRTRTSTCSSKCSFPSSSTWWPTCATSPASSPWWWPGSSTSRLPRGLSGLRSRA